MKQTKKEDGISPVVGVMLMLVVTIIVAAVVAAFVGGMSTGEQQAPSAKFDVSYKAQIADDDFTNSVPNYPVSTPKNNGLTFRLISGDSLELKHIKVVLTSDGKSITITPDLIRDVTSTVVDKNVIEIRSTDPDNPDTTQTYFAVPTGMDDSGQFIIATGETFTLLADGYYDNSEDRTAAKNGKFLQWTPKTGGLFAIQEFVPVTYTIFDTVSGKQIHTGKVTIK